MSGFEIFERIMVCVSPILIALIGLQGSRQEKKTKELVEATTKLNDLKKENEQKEKAALDEHFKKLDSSLEKLSEKVDKLDMRVESLATMETKLNGLIQLSSSSIQLCQSLSSIMSSVGDALDSTDIINSGDLKEELRKHREKENAITQQVMKIMY